MCKKYVGMCRSKLTLHFVLEPTIEKKQWCNYVRMYRRQTKYRQCHNLCLLSLAFLIDWRVVLFNKIRLLIMNSLKTFLHLLIA